MSENIIKNLQILLNNVTQTSYEIHKEHQSQLCEFVDNAILSREDSNILIGDNEIEVLTNNHINHAEFMHNMFLVKDAQTMFETYIWAYNSYSNRGFSFRYFFYELTAWKDALESLETQELKPLILLYEYLISIHDQLVSLATKSSEENIKVDSTVIDTYDLFLKAILKPDLQSALEISHKFIKNNKDITVFWEQIILPSLYTVGKLWSESKISVGEEHMATSICQRVMSDHYSKVIEKIDNKKPHIIVATSKNELHEVGARMLADLLELNGYYIHYLGSKTTAKQMYDISITDEISYILLSTTLNSNIDALKLMIAEIRTIFENKVPKIIVGGQAFTSNPKLKEFVDADICISSTNQLLEFLDSGEKE